MAIPFTIVIHSSRVIRRFWQEVAKRVNMIDTICFILNYRQVPYKAWDLLRDFWISLC